MTANERNNYSREIKCVVGSILGGGGSTATSEIVRLLVYGKLSDLKSYWENSLLIISR